VDLRQEQGWVTEPERSGVQGPKEKGPASTGPQNRRLITAYYNCQSVNRSLLMKKAPPLRQRGQGYEAKKIIPPNHYAKDGMVNCWRLFCFWPAIILRLSDIGRSRRAGCPLGLNPALR